MTAHSEPAPAGLDAPPATRDPTPLLERYDAIVFDLDGVLHRGDRVVASAPAVLARARERDVPIVFLTNNSSRTPEQVADRLSDLGLPADPDEVVTSALATASMLEGEGVAGRTAFVVGERGIRDALVAAGVRVLDGEPARADLVVVGWDRSADYAKLRTASLLVQRGARLVATNADRSFPAADGLWPGAGALLATITTTTGANATVVGKPARPMFEAAARKAGARRPLMVGDRLDTDVAGAAGVGWDSLLVLSGTTRAVDLVPAVALPTYVASDVEALLHPRTAARPRMAALDDVDGIAALLASAGLPVDGVADRLGRTVILPGSGGSAPDGGSHATGIPVATAAVVPVEGATYLRSVAVRPDVRGQGLGLLATAAALRLADPTAPAFLVTDDAMGLFERLGFEPVQREEAPPAILRIAEDQGCGSSGVSMRLEARA